MSAIPVKRCAACEGDIVHQDRLMITGTEIIHRSCAGRSTVLQRAQALDAKRCEHVARVQRERAEADQARLAALEKLARVERELQTLRDDHAALIAQYMRLRLDPPPQPVRSPPPVQAPTPPVIVAPTPKVDTLARSSEPSNPEETRSDAEVRFSLLELH